MFVFHKQNLCQRVIESEIGRKKTVIANILKDPDAYGTKKHTDKRKKISFGEKLGTAEANLQTILKHTQTFNAVQRQLDDI